ncbi:NADH-dependent flavin reductase subunit 2 [Streptomyces hundungensis]|uniref:NADH-dependent flavin reductase subunit 2 n=1 Tax=Streptomyces hundungensis TaxID=1077946 RepID=A0A387HLB0_9ACTN|nr:NAD(P)H-dependent oxidoreductase [Streptomyces hundungensis]AYG83073.1 NADH-dependent flavin reductase subunit 2 [Streptomyces hundungensis]
MDITTAEQAAPRLTVIIASNREGRFAPVVADWFLARAREHQGLDIEVLDLAETELPTALSHQPSPAVQAQLAVISPKLADADAFVVITPEYNHSFPAALKNLIDWHFVQWQAKPVGFVSYGGISGGLRAVEQLRQVFAETHSVTVRDTVSFQHVHGLFDENGEHREPSQADAAVKKMLDQVAWWAHALRQAKAVRPYAG